MFSDQDIDSFMLDFQLRYSKLYTLCLKEDIKTLEDWRLNEVENFYEHINGRIVTFDVDIYSHNIIPKWVKPAFLLLLKFPSIKLFKYVTSFTNNPVVTSNGATLLHCVCSMAPYEQILYHMRFLIEDLHLNVNAVDNDNRTCLFYLKGVSKTNLECSTALSELSEEAYYYLVSSCGVDVTLRDLCGNIATEHKLLQGHDLLSAEYPKCALLLDTAIRLQNIEKVETIYDNGGRYLSTEQKIDCCLQMAAYIDINRQTSWIYNVRKLSNDINENSNDDTYCDDHLCNRFGYDSEVRENFLIRRIQYHLFKYLELMITCPESRHKYFGEVVHEARYSKLYSIPYSTIQRFIEVFPRIPNPQWLRLIRNCIFVFNNEEIIQLLQASRMFKDEKGRTILHQLCSFLYVDLRCIKLIKLCFRVNYDPNSQDNEGNTPLHAVVKLFLSDESKQACQILIDNGAHTDALNHRKQPIEFGEDLKRFIKTQVRPLRCLSATMLARYIRYDKKKMHRLPKTIAKLVNLH